jgi:DNA-binding Lrp family transcriptional regulator
MEREGVITGYHAHLLPQALGRTLRWRFLVLDEGHRIKPRLFEFHSLSSS